MNFSIPLLALLMANKKGDSPSDSGRAALMAMMIRPPMMGLLVATVIARQAALLLKDPVVQRALRGLSRKDVRPMRQLEDAVRELHRAVDDVRDRLAFNGAAPKKGARRSNKKGGKSTGLRSGKRARAAGKKRTGRK